MSTGTPLENWVDAAKDAADDTALGALCFEELEKTAVEDWSTINCDCGGYIALTTPHEAIQIGWAADLQTCTALARSLLVLEDDDPDPEHSEIRDAMGELANIMAGAIKTKIVKGGVTNIQLGLPFFVVGRITAVNDVEESIVALKGGGMRCALHITRLALGVAKEEEVAA